MNNQTNLNRLAKLKLGQENDGEYNVTRFDFFLFVDLFWRLAHLSYLISNREKLQIQAEGMERSEERGASPGETHPVMTFLPFPW